MNCIIVDDEPIARKGIQNLLVNHTQINIVANCSSVSQLEKVLLTTNIDLIFLDINMPIESGLEYLQKQKNRNFGVIITTADSKYALDGYALNVLDYLVKPIREERFALAIDKAMEYHAYQNIYNKPLNYIFLKCEKVIEKILVQDILYLEAMRNYVYIYTISKKFIHYNSFKNIMDLMNPYGFLKVQKSFMVNPTKISGFNDHFIFINETKIPISRDHRHEIIESIKNAIMPK